MADEIIFHVGVVNPSKNYNRLEVKGTIQLGETEYAPEDSNGAKLLIPNMLYISKSLELPKKRIIFEID